MSPKTTGHTKGRRPVITKTVAIELYRENSTLSDIKTLGYGDEPLSSGSSTASLCCQVVTLLAESGYSSILCNIGMCDAILKLMAVHTLHPRVQLEGLSATQ